jgi:Zn-dependent M16 (insulinase) family peptidase
LIIKTLEGLRDGGIPPKTLDAALKGVEFSYREIKRGSGPYGLRLMRRCMRGWIFGLEPEGTMRVLGVLEEIKARLAREPKLFEGLIDELLLKNPHRATTVAYPETGLGERKREALAKACGERLSAMGKAERAALDAGLEGLRKFQTEPDSPEALASLPRVRVADLPHEIEIIATEEHRAGRVPVRYHGIFSNGVSYAEIAVDIGGLPRSLLPWIPLWSRFISSCGLPGLPYHEMSEKLAEAAGGYACILQTGSHCAASDLSRPGVFAVFRLKALDASLPRALGLIKDILLGADSGDAERLQDLYTELRNDLMAAIVPSGSSFAQARGCGALSAAGAIEESWRGVSQYDFLMGLGEKPDPAALKAAMDSIRTGLFPGAAAFISFTADEASREGGLRALGEFANALELGPMAAEPPRRAGELCAPLLPGKDEAYVIPSDVGFASAVMRSPRLGREGYAAHTVLASILSTGPLWNDIRMKRGAYGAWADADPLEGTFGLASYRDPGPAASLADFKKALEWAAGPELDQDEADRGILSVVSGDLRPLTPEEKGLSDMKRILFGVSDELRAGKRREMLGLGAGEIRAAARALLDGWGTKVQTVFAGEAAAREAREALPGIETRTLEL